jgi:metal-responsive CopG/Arc/MetJ family transcriptional regulator
MMMNMGKLTITLDDTLEKRFRDTIGRIKGYHRGSLSEALTEAITDWIAKNESNKKDTM